MNKTNIFYKLNKEKLGLLIQATYLVVKSITHDKSITDILHYQQFDDSVKKISEQLTNIIQKIESKEISKLSQEKKDFYIKEIECFISSRIKKDINYDNKTAQNILKKIGTFNV